MSLIATNYALASQGDVYRGEVRDIYTSDNIIVSIATDRLSVFGHLFPDPIPHKGQIINQLTAYYADTTNDIVPNWVESVPDPNVIIGKRCDPFKINMVIRGCLIGHAWRIYEAGVRQISGVELPDGLQQYDLFDEPIITPSTKAHRGYEEDISAAEIIAQGLMSEAQYERLSIVARQLFIRGKQMARDRGLILADTKYEFGLYDGQIYLIDEIHVPDTSRYFDISDHSAYIQDRTEPAPEDLSKEYIRQWLLAQGYSGLDDQVPPVMDEDFINQISLRYIELFERLTASKFAPATDGQLPADDRIKTAIERYL